MNGDPSVSALRLALASIFLLSLSVLSFEVALTRVFSVMLSYHFVFAIVSAAMLGLGAGGFLFKRLGAVLPERAIWIGALILSLSLAGSVLLILTLPIYDADAFAGVRFWLYVGLAIVPFVAAGFAVSGLFQRFSESSSYLYGADLLGAAAGAAGVVPAMDRFGAVNVVFLAAAVAAVGALLLGLPRLARALPALLALVVLVGFFTALVTSGAALPVPVANDPNKDMYRLFADPSYGARVVDSRWSSFGRTDLVASDVTPNEMTLYVDGAAGSPMYDLDAVLDDPRERMRLQMHSGGFFPFLFMKQKEKGSALILGPGGGRDVVLALLGGMRKITAVEVNPDLVEIVRQYEDYSGGIYSDRPGIETVVAEGRNFVRTSDERYDLIMASIPVTKSSRSVEGYALTENTLFTIEAFEDYLDRLTASGRMIIVAHNDSEILKLASIALAAYEKRGVSESDAMRRLYVVGSDMMPAIVIQKRPLSVKQANAMHTKIHELGLDKGATYFPWVPQQTLGPLRMFDQTLVDVAEGSLTMRGVVEASDLDLRPATDDRPFFYKFERGLPSPFRVFAILTGLSVLAVLGLVMLRQKRDADPLTFVGALRRSTRLKTYLALFFALGIGYMLIEIAFFQKLTLYIGQPQMALTVLLFSLLLGGGIGSLLSSLLSRRGARGGAWMSVGVALLITALAVLFPKVFAIDTDPRVAAVMLILPLGILMGCPMPLAVRGLRSHGLESHTSVMWGVNGAASVLGSALAMTVGISWGFSYALMLGAATYLGVALLFVMLAKAHAAQPSARGAGAGQIG